MKKSTRTILISVVAAIVVIVGGFGAFRWYQGKAEGDQVKATAQAYTKAFANRQYEKAVKQVDTSHLKGPGCSIPPKLWLSAIRPFSTGSALATLKSRI